MRTNFFTLLLVANAFSLFGQKLDGNSSSSFYPLDLVKTNRLTTLPDYNGNVSSLKSSLEDYLNVDGEFTLELQYHKSSPGGEHFLFEQILDGKSIYRGDLKVNLSKSGQLISWYRFPIEYSESPSIQTSQPTNLDFLNAMLPTIQEDVWFPMENGLLAAVRKEYHSNGSAIHVEVIEQPSSNEIIYWRDLNSYYHTFQADTNITVKVFNPDPLTTAQVNYGGVFSDQNDGDVSAINAQRQTKTVQASYSQGAFRLENPWIIMEDFESPSTAVPTSSTPSFDFTRSQSGFEDVNVFYHLTVFQFYMQSLGFQLVSSPISADAHGWNGADQSSFSPFAGLSFGEGGVDDGEDADVIVHEYGHAISYDASPNSNSGVERQTLDEAWGDYLAVSYSKSLNPHNWGNVFSWDGHNPFWPGRDAVTNKNYQSVSFNFNIYEHTDLWSGVLMEIQQQIGRSACDKVVLQGLYHSAFNMSFSDAALEIMAADTLLHFGQNAMAIYNGFNSRGILNIPNIGIGNENLTESGISVFNSYGFSNGTQALRIQSSKGDFKATFYDMNGSVLSEGQSLNGAMEVDSYGFTQGVYTVQIQNANLSETIRLIRF
jgi:zinc metalloprotease ZmpB